MPEERRRPNLLFVFSDQHRWCDLGCYGNPQVLSPHLDRFAGGALRFEQCISNSPVCVPARGSLLTGLFPLGHGALTNDLPMRHGVPSIADVLGAAGYRTGYIGKWHLAGVPRDQAIPAGPGRFGFQEWKACNCSHDYLNAYYFDEENRRVAVEGYEPVAQTDLAVDYLRRHRGEPWALYLSWGPPHDPYHAVPEEYLAPYRDAAIALRPNVPERILQMREHFLDREQIREWHRGYYAHVTALDEQFGRLLAALDETGQAKDTIVVYTSDHGDMLGSQGLTNKQLPHEESIRVPLLVRWPGRVRVGVAEELIGLVDLPASLLGLAGLRFPGASDARRPTAVRLTHPGASDAAVAVRLTHRGEVDGADLHRLFTDPGARGLDACYLVEITACHHAVARGDREWRGLRTRRHTFARTAADEGWVLFDNLEDPYQQRNLIGRPEAEPIRRDLLAQLDERIARHDRLLPWDEFLREFGYREAWNRSQAHFGLPVLE